MLKLLEPCCIPGGRALPKFRRYAANGNCSGVWAYFEHCLKFQKPTGEWWKRKGNVPFEDVRDEMGDLYRQCRSR